MTETIRRLRVFPRSIRNATPRDPGVRIGPPGLFDRDLEQISISVSFTWDLPEAERIAQLWSERGPTQIGGLAHLGPAIHKAGFDSQNSGE